MYTGILSLLSLLTLTMAQDISVGDGQNQGNIGGTAIAGSRTVIASTAAFTTSSHSAASATKSLTTSTTMTSVSAGQQATSSTSTPSSAAGAGNVAVGGKGGIVVGLAVVGGLVLAL